jgi:hypothetical protein
LELKSRLSVAEAAVRAKQWRSRITGVEIPMTKRDSLDTPPIAQQSISQVSANWTVFCLDSDFALFSPHLMLQKHISPLCVTLQTFQYKKPNLSIEFVWQ